MFSSKFLPQSSQGFILSTQRIEWHCNSFEVSKLGFYSFDIFVAFVKYL